MCFPTSVILEKKLAGKNRTHFSNTTHDPILHTKYHPQLPTYFAFYAHAKFSPTQVLNKIISVILQDRANPRPLL